MISLQLKRIRGRRERGRKFSTIVCTRCYHHRFLSLSRFNANGWKMLDDDGMKKVSKTFWFHSSQFPSYSFHHHHSSSSLYSLPLLSVSAILLPIFFQTIPSILYYRESSSFETFSATITFNPSMHSLTLTLPSNLGSNFVTVKKLVLVLFHSFQLLYFSGFHERARERQWKREKYRYKEEDWIKIITFQRAFQKFSSS